MTVVDVEQFITEWNHLWINHTHVTGEYWLHGSPSYGVAKYHIPEWQFWATKNAGYVAQNQSLGVWGPQTHDVEFVVWSIEMPDLLLEMMIPWRIKLVEDRGLPNFWHYLHGNRNSMGSVEWVGDLSQFEGMIAHYKLVYDWGKQS